MKKPTKTILISLAALILVTTIGVAVMISTNIGDRFQSFISKPVIEDTSTIRKKQLDYLKNHEQDIVDYVKSQNPKIESVQIDWDSMEVEQSGNGTPQGGGYNLSLSGKFNNLENTEFTVDFYLDHKDDIPDIDMISMLNPPMIDTGDLWDIYGDE